MSYEWKWIITVVVWCFLSYNFEERAFKGEPPTWYNAVLGFAILSVPLTFVSWLWRL